MNRQDTLRILIFATVVTAFYFFFPRHSATRQIPQETRRFDRPESGRRSFEGGNEQPESLAQIDCSSQYFSNWIEPATASCQIDMKNGYPVPDSRCTPGGIDPSISISVLRNPEWRTRAVRNCESSEAQKHIAYSWYSIQKPRINSNQNQVCELDHLVPLELGGADGLGHIWPECGPNEVTLNERYFKRKDRVENYLAEEVRAGNMSLDAAQRGIASDWTQYMGAAEQWCANAGRC